MVNAGGQRADVARADVARVGRVWDAWGAWRVGRVGRVGCVGRVVRVGAWCACARGSLATGARESAWERVGTRGARGGAWGRVGARGRTSGGAWGRVWRARNFWRRVGGVRGQIRPILVSMDRS